MIARTHIVSFPAASPGNWHMIGRMMMNCVVVKRDPRPRKRKRPDKSTDGKYGSSLPIILHLNIESPSARKIWVFSQLVTRLKALVIFRQETHCTNTYQLMMPHFALASMISSKKQDLTTFVHEKLSWARTDRSPEGSESA